MPGGRQCGLPGVFGNTVLLFRFQPGVAANDAIGVDDDAGARQFRLLSDIGQVAAEPLEEQGMSFPAHQSGLKKLDGYGGVIGWRDRIEKFRSRHCGLHGDARRGPVVHPIVC